MEGTQAICLSSDSVDYGSREFSGPPDSPSGLSETPYQVSNEQIRLYLNPRAALPKQKRDPKLGAPRPRDYTLMKDYKMTPQDYDMILVKQNGVCAICKRPEKTVGRSLAIDHDHKTGHVRGLLCGRCNLMLGVYEDFREKYGELLEAHLKQTYPFSKQKREVSIARRPYMTNPKDRLLHNQ